jgi:methylmalonyl-CoA/ethylmalonyl-CoA epimerase
MMKRNLKITILIALSTMLGSCNPTETALPVSYGEVDQVLWVVSDLQRTIEGYELLGFNQVNQLGEIRLHAGQVPREAGIRLAAANLGGARVNWVEPVDPSSLFSDYLETHGEGAMALIHRFPDKKQVRQEIKRLKSLGIDVLDQLSFEVMGEQVPYVLMDTGEEGKYILGFTWGEHGSALFDGLESRNRHALKLNQYAFAIRDPEPVSDFWSSMGLPPLEISHPELGSPMYYGEPADHELIQGWQRHGSIAYEWCIPVKPPIVYEDHINLHGEGIHHLAFSVNEMDPVLDDFRSRGFVVSMGGTWGESGKPGSGRYEYIDLEQTGGVTMELLWNYRE